MPRTATFVTFGTIVAVLLLNLALPTILPSVPIARASSRTISLVGNQAGWNYTLPSGVNPNITVTEGDTITVNLNSSDFAHNFFVDVAGNGMWTCPPNVGCSHQFGPVSTATITFTVNFAPGTYKYVCSLHPVGMRGNFIVQPIPDFSLSSTPSSLIVGNGSNTSRISIVSTDNTSGNVALTAGVSPSGPRVGINPAVVMLSSTVRSANATLTVLIPSGTSPGQYAVTVTGDNGTVSHTTTVQVTVPSPDFILGFSSPSASILQGSSTNFTIVVTSIAGFSGTINLADHVSSDAVNTTLSPSTVTVSPGGFATSLLHLTTSSSTPAGVYNITVTGSGPAGQHSTTVTLNVVSPPLDGTPFGWLGLIAVTVVSVLVVGLTTILYRRWKPIRETRVNSVV